MQLALDAIKRSETGEKADIIKALFETKDRSSALGTYSIDDNGDTSLTDMSLDGVEDGQLTFDQGHQGLGAVRSGGLPAPLRAARAARAGAAQPDRVDAARDRLGP